MKKQVKNNLVKYLLILVLTMPITACNDEDPTPAKRPDKDITAFSLPSLELTGVVDPATRAITLTVARDFDQTRLESVVPYIEYTGVSIEPAATEPQNFSRDVTYKVTAEDGTSQNYTVVLSVSDFVAAGIGRVYKVWEKSDWAALGFSPNSENTLGVLGNELVASRSGIILDAATGEPTGAKLNVTGAEGKFQGSSTYSNYPFAVGNDDAGNLIGVSLGAWTKPSWPVYKWTTSAAAPPTLVYELNDPIAAHMGRKVTVVGDVNGNGWLTNYNANHTPMGCSGDGTQFIWKIAGGVVDPNRTELQARPKPVTSTYGYQQLWPMTVGSIYPFYLSSYGSASGNQDRDENSQISYTANASTAAQVIDGFIDPNYYFMYSSNWGAYVYHSKKFDFNGVTYLAVLSVSADQELLTGETSPAFNEYGKVVYFLSILDTRNDRVVETIIIPKGDAADNGNGSASVTAGKEETLGDGEKRIRLYSLITNRGVFCHEITNKQ